MNGVAPPTPRRCSDDSAPGGVCVLPAKVLQRIRQPTGTLRTSTLGDAIGFGWVLRWADRPRPDLAGTALVITDCRSRRLARGEPAIPRADWADDHAV